MLAYIDLPRKQRNTNFLLLVLLIATTANPYFFDSNEFLIAGLAVAGFVFLVRGKTLDLNYFKIILLFIVIDILQILIYQIFEIGTFLSLFIKLTFAYFVVRCLEGLFFSYYIRTIYVICLISLCFYVTSYIPGFFDFVYSNVTPLFEPPFYKMLDFYKAQRNIIIYTYDYDCFLTFRNPGPFWEPGIFAIFIIIGLLFTIIQEKRLLGRTGIVLIFTLLSTISTAGYLALFLLLFFYYLFGSRVRFKLIYVVGVVFLAIHLYFTLPFLSEKVAQNVEMSNFTGSRFGSFVADWALFVKSPWIGWGCGSLRFGDASQAVFTQEMQQLHRNNGLASLITEFGIILSVFYFYLYYRTLRSFCWLKGYNRLFAASALAVILFISFSQVIYTRPFFLSLLFLGMYTYKINRRQHHVIA